MKAPKKVTNFAQQLKSLNLGNGNAQPHFDLLDVWLIDGGNTLQIDYYDSDSGEYGDRGYSISTEDGEELYQGLDMSKAIDSIKNVTSVLT